MKKDQSEVVSEALAETGCRDVPHLVKTLIASLDSHIRANAQIFADNTAARAAVADLTARLDRVTDGVRFGCECGRTVSITWCDEHYFPAGHHEDVCMGGART